MVQLILLSIGMLLLAATPAYAYLDPGSGSMVVQLLLGGVAGAAVLLRMYWSRLLARLGFRQETAASKRSD
jgi:hypothetical protein